MWPTIKIPKHSIRWPGQKHGTAVGTCRLPDFLWGPSIRRICSTQDLRCVLLQRIYVLKLCLLSWFRICIHIVNPKCHLLKAPKIEFTFSALSSAHWTLQCQNQNKIVYCFTNCLFRDELLMLLCIAVLRDFSRIVSSFVHIGQYWTRFTLLRFATQTYEIVRFSTFLRFLPKQLFFENLPLRWFSSMCPQAAAELGFELVTRESCSNSPCIAVWRDKIQPLGET